MNVNQRDVFLLPHPLGNYVGDPHPHIVLSVLDINQYENTFIAVMITSSPFTHDELSFQLYDDMFEKPLRKEHCHVRMHLVTLSLSREIIPPKINTMSIRAFSALMREIGDCVFNCEMQLKRGQPM